jgi:hypothetical protein
MQIDVNSLRKDTLFTKVMNLRPDTNDVNNLNKTNLNNQLTNSSGLPGPNDVNDANRTPKVSYVRGPYGPPWPYITQPVEMEFGDARLTIEFIDENAKLPLVWGFDNDPNSKTEAQAAVVTFCEWMKMEPNDMDPLLKSLKEIKDVKPFSIALKSVGSGVQDSNAQSKDSNSAAGADNPRQGTRRVTRTRPRGRTRQQVIVQGRPDIGHTMDYAKILHSPMLDIETLAKPVNKDENRTESALKYISLWGTQKVNVNTAPRQVLEAAFTFGGDSVEIAKQIIELRRKKPFKDIDDLTKKLYSYNSSIDKTKPYITAQSDCFMIRVKATSGVAEVSATAGVKKVNGKFQQIGIIIE